MTHAVSKTTILALALACATAQATATAQVTAAATARATARADDGYPGRWTGIITQEAGATTRYFDMVMDVGAVLGRDSAFTVNSHVMDGDYHAYMAADAFVASGGELIVVEREIVRADSIPNMEWCVKRFRLRRSMEAGSLHLRGEWLGDASFGPCIPGDIDLVREVVRP